MNKKGDKMSVKDAKLQVKQLKKQIKATNKENDLLLLKLFVLMVFLAVVAAVIHGKITLPI